MGVISRVQGSRSCRAEWLVGIARRKIPQALVDTFVVFGQMRRPPATAATDFEHVSTTAQRTRKTYPDIIAFLHQHERQTPFPFRQAHPCLTVHHQAMMQVHHLLRHAPLAGIHPCILFTSSPSQSMKTQQVAIPGLDDMFLGIVAEQSTEIHEIRSLGDRRRNSLSASPKWSALRRV